MKKDIHPEYHEIKVVMTDGSSFRTRSTWGKSGDSLKLDVDRLTHPAWIRGARKLVDTGGRVASFQRRFSGLKLGEKTAPKVPTEQKAELTDIEERRRGSERRAISGEGVTPPSRSPS